jgi:adenylate cyclase class IV
MAEIEIEKKFLLTENQKNLLLADAQLVGDFSIEDSYFDSDDYRLTLNDYWLRLRDGAYELKAPLQSGSGSYEGTNRYRELTDIAEICTELNLEDTGDFAATLGKNGLQAFITLNTARTSYKKDGFKIDIDQATYVNSEFTYAVAEIELLISDESFADEADAKIISFAKQFNLGMDEMILGKVAAFMEVERPAHYKALVEAGVLK